jgi:hypothetical protein
MRIIIPILSLLAFLWLSYESRQEHGYNTSEFAVLDNTKEQQIMDIWQIDDEDLIKPVSLWK